MTEVVGKGPRSGRRRDVAERGGPAVRLVGAEPESEQALLLRAARGDEDAVRALYREHVSRVHRHVSRVLGQRDAEVEDVVQQVFLAALDGAAAFEGRSRLATWLLGIATRRALDEARARSRRERWGRVRERVGMGRGAARPDTRLAALSEAERALAALTADQRTAFLLVEVEGHTLAEASEMIGAGISTVHARIKAARKRLDTALAQAEDGSVELDGGRRGSAA